jgi:amidase
MGPNRGEGWGGMVSDGVLSRTVRDTAAAMDAICGYEPGAPYAAPPKTGKYLDVVSERTSKKLRIAVWREAWNGIAIAPECQAAIEKTAALCRELGHEVIEAKPPEIDFDGFVRAHGIVLATNIVLAVDLRLKTLGRTLQEEDLESVIRDGYSIGKSLAATDYVDSISRFHAIGRALTKFMATYDLVLTPTLAQLPAKLQHLAMSYGGFWAFREKTSHYSTYLPIINASGQPAASIPLYSTETGVPVASQLIGHFGREDVVLDLAAQLERIAPWKDRKPLLNI